jgi:hypothetical protein
MTPAQMRATVFAKKPVFKATIEQFGHIPLSAYTSALIGSYKPTKVPSVRRRELITAVALKTRTLLGAEAARSISRTLRRNYIVSTGPHHDFATHPFFSHSLIVNGHAYAERGHSTVPVLTCAGISLNNSSFPRGLIFHNEKNIRERINLISLKEKHRPVYNHPPLTLESIQKGSSDVKNPKIAALLRATLSRTVIKRGQLTEQITLVVDALSRKIPGLTKTRTVYLAQEELAAELFMKRHLAKKTVPHRIVFDTETRANFITFFEGINGAHDSKKGKGTHLFWLIESGKRIPLMVSDNELVTHDKLIKIPLTPGVIASYLRTKRIMPAMSLTLPLLSFYYGLGCIGGFSQIGYLGEMKQAYLKLLAEISAPEIEQRITVNVPTTLFSGDFILATLDDNRTPATLLDILTRTAHFTEGKLKALAKETTLAQAVDRMMPELYKIIALS